MGFLLGIPSVTLPKMPLLQIKCSKFINFMFYGKNPFIWEQSQSFYVTPTRISASKDLQQQFFTVNS